MAKDWEIPQLLDAYGPFLTEKQRAITAHYYDEDLSLAEIAENEGVTRQAVRDVILRTEEQLRDMEEKLQVVARSRADEAALARLRQAAADGNPDLAAMVVAYCDGRRKETEHGV